MLTGVTASVILLAAVVVLWLGLVESQCTTRHCEVANENDPLSVCLRNQDVVEQVLHVVERLQEEVNELKDTLEKHTSE